MASKFRGISQRKPAQDQISQQLQARFQQAFALHQKGQFRQAQAIYQEILKVQPRHFDSLHFLGVVAIQTGSLELGIQLIGEAIKVNPDVASAYNNRGSALQDLKRLDEALASYDKALSLKPDYAEAYNNRGNALLDLKRPDEALASYGKALSLRPDYADAYSNRGNALLRLERLNEALASYDKALSLNPDCADTFNNRGNALLGLKRLDEALASFDRALSLKPTYADAYSNRGNALLGLKRLSEAVASYDKALSLSPERADAYNNRGIALRDLKRLDEALASYDKALSLKPDYAEAYNNRGNALLDLKRPDEALASYGKALSLRPDYADAYSNRGNALLRLERLNEALASYDKALSLNPDCADTFNNRGNALLDLKRPDEALASFDRALSLSPERAGAYNNRGNALLDLERSDEALASFDKALLLKPDYADAYNNRGNALLDLKRLGEALASYDKSLSLKPDCAKAYNNRGIALRELKRLDEALASYDKALSLNPAYPDAYNNRGDALLDLKRLDEAVASYGKALSLEPDYEDLLGTILHAKMTLCDWDGLTQSLSLYERSISGFKRVTAPFPALSLLDAPELHKIVAEVYAKAKYPRSQALGAINMRSADRKIRIGYYSADFHNHAIASLTAELFEAHNAERFELYGFSFGPDKHDEMRKRVSSAFDKFIEVRDKSDREVATLSRKLGIDIAVDLNGFTEDSRTRIFAEGCAPIQVNYLGYPGTMGAEYIDYVIADRTVIPECSQSAFEEKVVYLPHSYQVNDSKRRISNRIFTKQQLGLPGSGFVFCCFNSSYKILPATFGGWMKIINAVEGSVLWLLEDNPIATENLRKEAEQRGVDSNRLVFAKRMPLDEHLARHRLADLFIDTLPYNAHTTTSDALWAGLPVLTCLGKSFASRVAASLLNAIEMPELVAHTQAEYEAKAIELATNPDKLENLKNKLEKNRLTTPLFNGKLFARHIESAYETMYARYQAGLPPAGIDVQPQGSQEGSC